MKRVLQKGVGSTDLNKSRFLAVLAPLSTLEEAPGLLVELKRAYPKADHYPYACRVEGKGRSSDDGEPGGSAGRPLLTLLESEGIDNAFLGVARYFGGSKLGVGNLRRCFVEAGKDAIANAKFGIEEARFRYLAQATYSEYQDLERLSQRMGFQIAEKEFQDEVRLTLIAKKPLEEAFQELGLAHTLKEKEEILWIMEA